MSTPSALAQTVAGRRAEGPHTSMFVRMLIRAAVLRRGRAASALLAMVVAAAVATAMLNLYVDVQAKLRKEFRNYGANVVVVGKDGKTLSVEDRKRIEGTVGSSGIAVPFSYVVARTADGQSVVVAGTDFDLVQRLNSWWSVTAWPSVLTGDTRSALVGKRALAVVSQQGKPFDLSFEGHTIHLEPTGTLVTGAAEDSRVYLSRSDFENWTGVRPSTVELAASGSPEEINALIQKLSQAVPDADVRPVRQIMEGEARVLGKTRATLLVSAILIIVTAALCVLSTLIGWVFDRRRDFAIMKALGASERLLTSFFAAEAAALGTVGAVAGFVVGVGVAMWIGHANFHAPVVPRFSVLPWIVAGSVGVALVSSIMPITLLRRVQPAMILRGE
jgi:putative ABC transport system permease protein